MDRHVLCVDDNQDNNEILKLLFEQEGIKVTTCLNADEGLESLKHNEYSAIVLDVRMPGKNGIEVCREIRRSRPHIPIVFFSADARDVTAQTAIEAEADIFLVKPDDIANVVPAVVRLIETKQ